MVGVIMLSCSGNFVMTFTPRIVLEDLACVRGRRCYGTGYAINHEITRLTYRKRGVLRVAFF